MKGKIEVNLYQMQQTNIPSLDCLAELKKLFKDMFLELELFTVVLVIFKNKKIHLKISDFKLLVYLILYLKKYFVLILKN